MKTLIVYESMYGNTHRIAEQVARAFEGAGPVHVLPAETATPELVKEADLLIVGGPTHAHGLSSGQSRQGARDAVTKPGSDLNLDPDNEGAGLRDWFNSLGQFEGKHAAAFDTRMDMPRLLPRRAPRELPRRQALPPGPWRGRTSLEVGRAAVPRRRTRDHLTVRC
jgi:hypothetical protein